MNTKPVNKLERRRFLQMACGGLLAGFFTHKTKSSKAALTDNVTQSIKLFLCGDVMSGRGIDQILPHPSDPELFEPVIRSALSYVKLAEEKNGPITWPVEFPYIWGDTLDIFAQKQVDLRIINLETSVTTSNEAWLNKGIHYRMNPANIPCLSAAGIDCCVLANNHVLDWGYSGLIETLETLHKAGIATAGAGRDAMEAATPAIFNVPGKGRVLVFGWAMPYSGTPKEWTAGDNQAGVNLLADLSFQSLENIKQQVLSVKQPDDTVIASIHWGGNWGFTISRDKKRFAHELIDKAGIDLLHGHSSHHVKGIEVYKG